MTTKTIIKDRDAASRKTDRTLAAVTQRQLPSPDLSLAKDVERMKLRDGIITPEMVRCLSSIEVVEALLTK